MGVEFAVDGTCPAIAATQGRAAAGFFKQKVCKGRTPRKKAMSTMTIAELIASGKGKPDPDAEVPQAIRDEIFNELKKNPANRVRACCTRRWREGTQLSSAPLPARNLAPGQPPEPGRHPSRPLAAALALAHQRDVELCPAAASSARRLASTARPRIRRGRR